MSFTLLLESDAGIKGPGNLTSSVGYNFNWSILPDNFPYEMTFSFVSQDAGALTASSQYEIRINNLNAVSRAYAPTSKIVASSTTTIGLVRPSFVNNSYFLSSTYQDNPPIYLLERPSGNTFSVDVISIDGVTVPAYNMKWALILFFKKL
jgi:hypothetical protein